MPRVSELDLPTDPIRVQLQNRATWNETRPRDLADFYTIGYMRRDIGSVLAVLLDAKVMTVLDVRYTPISMYKPDFSKSNLKRHLAGAGIDYVHLPNLGVPRDIRGKAAGETTRAAIWTWYDRHVIPFVNLHTFYNSGNYQLTHSRQSSSCLDYAPGGSPLSGLQPPRGGGSARFACPCQVRQVRADVRLARQLSLMASNG